QPQLLLGVSVRRAAVLLRARLAQEFERELRVARADGVEQLRAKLQERPASLAHRAFGVLSRDDVGEGYAEERASALLVARPDEVGGLRAYGRALLRELE